MILEVQTFCIKIYFLYYYTLYLVALKLRERRAARAVCGYFRGRMRRLVKLAYSHSLWLLLIKYRVKIKPVFVMCAGLNGKNKYRLICRTNDICFSCLHWFSARSSQNLRPSLMQGRQWFFGQWKTIVFTIVWKKHSLWGPKQWWKQWKKSTPLFFSEKNENNGFPCFWPGRQWRKLDALHQTNYWINQRCE